MLVARRDPFHPGAHDISYEQGAGAAIGRAPRLARTVSMLQVVGSLLAIPVGLASGYSIYRANFSPDTTCQGLRGSIVSMIDKSMDAATRRMLVRRDVEKFEQDCGAIDPEATAAFKSLLASDKPAAPVAAPVVRRVDTPPQEQVRKVEARPQAVAKQAPIAAAPAAVSERARRDPAVSDAQWLDAVRHALVPHDAEPAVDKTPDAVLHAQWPGQQEVALPPRAAPASTAAVPVVAPALPPAATVAAPPVPQPDASHPVPPAAIPDPVDVAVAEPQEHPSRVRRWIAKIPLMGNVINNGL